jgi:hypothetical protein
MSVASWSSPAFVESARAWVGEQCDHLGVTLTGEWEQPHVRPWSTAIRVESTAGRLWFKANGPGILFEAALTAALGRLCPGLVPEVLAADGPRGWSLTRDAGPVLRSVLDPNALWDIWPKLLPRYATAQLELAEHADELLATGIDVRSPATLPGQARRLLEELAATPVERGGLTAEQAGRLANRLGEYDAWCAELEASGIPSTVQHDDLHSSNVCWNGTVADARVIDWGDASWGHPLATMLCTLNSIAFHADTGIDDPRVERCRDAFLEPFCAHGSHAELVRLVGLARRAGAVTRAVSYEAAVRDAPVEVLVEQDWPVRGWFLEILED